MPSHSTSTRLSTLRRTVSSGLAAMIVIGPSAVDARSTNRSWSPPPTGIAPAGTSTVNADTPGMPAAAEPRTRSAPSISSVSGARPPNPGAACTTLPSRSSTCRNLMPASGGTPRRSSSCSAASTRRL